MTSITSRFSRRRLRIALAVAIVTFLSVGGTATASAYWTATASAVGATAATTSESFTMSNVNVLDNAFKFTGSTGPLTIKPITVANTGGTPLNYTLTDSISGSTTLAGNIKVWDWVQTGGSCGTTTVGTAGTLSNLPSLPSGAQSNAAGASFVLCIATQLNTTDAASQGLSTTAAFTMTGSIGSNWSSTASSSTTQSVYQLGALGAITCVNRPANDGYGVTLTWPILAGATGGYQAFAGTATTPFATVAQPTTGTTASIRLNYQEDSSSYVIGNVTSVKIVPIDSTYGTTGTGQSQTLHAVNILILFTTLNCN